MIIPETANNLHMPITKNIPIDLYNATSWWKKFKLWKFGIPKEELIEDFYQILPIECNELLGFNKNKVVCCFIPKGFIFNGASIPKMLSSLYLPHGILYLGAFHHDFLYTYGGLLVFTEEMTDLIFIKTDQKSSDMIFNFINEELNNFKTATKPAYLSLRGFGNFTWNKCRKIDTFSTDFSSYKEVYNKRNSNEI